MSEPRTEPKSNVTVMDFAVFEKAAEYARKVSERLMRASRALDEAGVPYAVIGGNAVMAWVASADESAIRPTQDVDILLDPKQFDFAKAALEKAGFVYRHVASIDLFLDGPSGKAREGLHVIFAGRKVRPEYAAPAPAVDETVRSKRGFFILTLEALVRMKLTSYRHKDIVHLQDFASVELIDYSWLDKYPSPLHERLKQVLDNPEA